MDKILSTNELATIDFTKKLSALTNTSEELIDTILDALALVILENARKQWDITTEDTVKLHIPKIMDVDVRFTNTDSRNQISAYYIKWDERFIDKSSKVMNHEDNYLTEQIIKSCGDIIIDKFLRIINED